MANARAAHAVSRNRLQVNPILKREMRARWRGWRGFALVFAAACALTAGMALLYSANAARFSEGARIEDYSQPGSAGSGGFYLNGVWTPYSSITLRSGRYTGWGGIIIPSGGSSFASYTVSTTQRADEMAKAGRDIFLTLTLGQTVAWLLIAPALTATGLASEREAGLLESLQLTPLGGKGIVRGKLLSTLSLGALLLLLPMPAVAVCFLMGGVSPGDFGRAFGLQASVFMTAASLGTYWGARSRTNVAALFSSYASLVGWGLVLCGLNIAAFNWWGAGRISTLGISAWSLMVNGLLMSLNPLTATLSAAGETRFDNFLLYGGGSDLIWQVGLAFQMLLTILFVRGAMRMAAKPLPERAGRERGRGWTDAWRERVERRERLELQRVARTAATATAYQVSSDYRLEKALLRELPLGRLLSFRNPVLQREVRALFRWRMPRKLWMKAAYGIGAILLASAYLLTVFAASDNEFSLMLFPMLAKGAFDVALLVPALLAAPTFARERENGTWEALRLSILPPGEVLRGKLLAPMVTCLYWSIPVWPPLLIAGWRVNSSMVWLMPVILPGAALLGTMWALCVSWKCRRTVTAVCVTLGTLLGWMFGWTFMSEYLTPLLGFAPESLTWLHLPTAFSNIVTESVFSRLYSHPPSPSAYFYNGSSYVYQPSMVPDWMLSPEAGCVISLMIALGVGSLLLGWLLYALRRARDPEPTRLRSLFLPLRRKVAA